LHGVYSANTFCLINSYSTAGPISTVMGDCLWACKPPWFQVSQLGRLGLFTLCGMIKWVSTFELSSHKWRWWV